LEKKHWQSGFAPDLTEDHLEQIHQTMDKIHQPLGRLGFGANLSMASSRLAKMSKDPQLTARELLK
jgi:hypothetical protein